MTLLFIIAIACILHVVFRFRDRWLCPHCSKIGGMEIVTRDDGFRGDVLKCGACGKHWEVS